MWCAPCAARAKARREAMEATKTGRISTTPNQPTTPKDRKVTSANYQYLQMKAKLLNPNAIQ